MTKPSRYESNDFTLVPRSFPQDFLFGVAFSGADSKPVTVGLNNMANTTSSVKNYNVDMAAAIIAGLPTMLVYVLAGQYFVKGLTAGAVKG